MSPSEALPIEVVFHDARGDLVRRIVMSRDAEGRLLTEVAHFSGDSPFPNLAGDIVLSEDRQKLAALLANAFADRTLIRATYA